jgi:hypothetical protein
MSSQAWTPAEETLLLTLVQQGKTAFEIWQLFQAQGIGRTQKAVTRKIQDSKLADPQRWRPQLVRSEMPRFNEPLQVVGDVLNLNDIHCPFQDTPWIDRVVNLAIRWGITQAVIGGDLADMNAFSSYGRDTGIDADMELDTLSRFMDALCQTFEVYYFAGNHDTRPLRALKDAGLSIKWLMQMFTPSEHCHISDYYWCRLTSGNSEFQIEHPKNVSVNATIVARKLAEKHHVNVIAGHGHLWGMSYDASGRYTCIDSGICADTERMAYVTLRHSTRPTMISGAVIVVDGMPILLGKDNISFYERMHP